MKRTAWAVLAALALAGLTPVLSACNNGNQPAVTTPDYSYNNEDTTGDGTAPADGTGERFTVDVSWQQNYAAEYKYFERVAGEETVTIREARTAVAFSARYPANGNFVYYAVSGSDLDCYTAVPAEEQYVHTVLKNKSLNELSSTFMKLTAVSAGLPELSNVLYMGEETVGGRACKKYIQRAYENGAVTETVYVWVDAEFGFAMKCEAYNADEELQTYWEVTSFAAGHAGAADLGVELSDYTFTEGN